jgi:protein HIRA/HIR1
MARHTGAVTVVKFSPDGRFLASGSDDKVLLIWERDEENRPSFGEQNLEHWTVTKRVVAHDNDIQDIAWAPDSSILVSVGLDRSIMIWNGNTFERIKRFDVHQSHVKGVVFDPANKYFATSSDDRSVRIFRYHKGSEISFSIERTVLKPFKKSPLTTYYRRLSWSPDGQFIAVPNATNGPVTSVAVISRGSWESDISLIGHDSPCEVASFSPVLYEVPSPSNPKEKKITSIVATAGQDKNLVIWNNAYPRAMAVFENISLKTVTDLCWSPDGSTLYISSLDGTISAINFEPGELGTVVSSEKNDELLNKYGVDKDSMVFPESTSQLILEDKAAEFSKTLSENHMDRLLRLEKQTVEKTPVPPKLAPKPSIPRPGQEKTKLNRAVITNGKKRVAPTLISTTSHAATLDKKFQSAAITSKKEVDFKVSSKLSKTHYDLPRFGLQTAVNPFFIKKTNTDVEGEEDEGDEIDDYEETQSEEELAYKRRRVKHHQRLIKLREPLEDSNIVMKQLTNEKHRSVIEIVNHPENNTDELTIILAHNDGKREFEYFVQDRIIGITGQLGRFWALATDNGGILTFAPSGRVLLPRMELSGNIVYFTSREELLMVVTDDHMIHSFNIIQGKKLHKKVSLAPILNYDETFEGKKFELKKKLLDIDLKNGRIVVYLSTNEIHIFDKDMRTWVKVIDSFYTGLNNYRGLWTGNSKSVKNTNIDFSREEEFTKKLVFLEGYETMLSSYLDDPEGSEHVKKDLELVYRDEMYSKVRGK